MKRISFLLSAATLLMVGPTHAQQDPTRIGAGQLPFILVVLDTSGSTEWTQKGDDRFPEGTAAAPGPDEWQPGTGMEADGNNDGPHRFGPCFVWEPSSCNNYHRPGWSPNVSDWGYGSSDGSFRVPGDGHLRTRMRAMRGGATYGSGVRLSKDSMPRHIILKEAMTGNMVLRNYDQAGVQIANLGAVANAPGCWFVPRQRGASIQPNDQDFCTSSRFTDFPDHDEPLPHFQEVFDGQLPNGLMDTLFTSAIFGFAGLDGYREDHDWDSDSDTQLNDDIDGNAPTGATRPDSVRALINEDSGGFDLGLSRIIAPKSLDIEQRFLANIADHVQLALVDSGYLARNTDSEWRVKVGHKKKDGRPELGITYQQGTDQYLDDLYLGRQPIARATPLAAAVMDARQFFTEDSRFSEPEDPYAQCRPKQVVIVTDGTPFPEAPGGAGNELGNVGLTPAFGYDNCNLPWVGQQPPPGCEYAYDTTESEIAGLIAGGKATLASGSPPVTGADLARFQSRVHVVGLDVGTTPQEQADIAQKLSTMARAGETCAEYFLRADPAGAISAADTWIPISHGGGCDPTNAAISPRGCLVPGQVVYNDYVTPDGITWTQPCQFPALILSRSTAEGISQAMSTVFNGIIGSAGVASRTRAVVSDFLDDDNRLGGGQYRIYSGSRISGSRFWRGILNRELLPCDNTPNSYTEGAGVDTSVLGDESVVYRALHADVADQVSCQQDGSICVPGTKADNRRIFTAIPTDDVFDYTTRAPRPITSVTAVDSNFATRFPIYALPANSDEFRAVTIPGVVATDAPKTVGTRIPFRRSEIIDAISATTGGGAAAALAYFDILDEAALEFVVDVHRGRIPEKAVGADGSTDRRNGSRVITGILNATPVVVPPPVRDLPIESYRDYRSFYGGRPTMIYASTTDGQLHAIHAGELQGRIAIREMTPDGNWMEDQADPALVGGASMRNSTNALIAGQREAWSFIPPMVLRDLPSNSDTQPYLMDGTPVVKDVRLCQRDGTKNQNTQACGVAGASTLSGAQQWRTVLVQGRGLAGNGYYALDVTRPGGLRVDAGLTAKEIERPDPVFLWEFDAEWERAQVVYMESDAVPRARIATSSTPTACSSPPSDFWAKPMLGESSVSTPEIATLAINVGTGAAPRLEQRPVAVFGGGLGSTDGCTIEGSGSAIYIVDLQTGSILRRFVADNSGVPFVTYGSVFTGSPSLYDASTGSVATFGFIGDSDGRMWALDLRQANPQDWTVSLALDPMVDTSARLLPLKNMVSSISGGKVGPASGKPSIAMGPERRLVVTYGLGEPGDTTSGNEAQAVITLIQSVTVPGNYDINWVLVFSRGEKMTGDSLTFNGVTYFPTYAQDPADNCAPGYARIYAVKYFSELGTPESGIDPTLLTNPDLCPNFGVCGPISPSTNGLWFGPKEPTLIRGLTLTLGPICAARGLGDDPSGFDDSAGSVGQPQLIAQTGAMPDATIPGDYMTPKGGADAIGRITVDVARRQGPVVPLSWISIQ